ncbi:MAG: 3,4-dehydroadipyl-CoA semialdehyde dehydrogenase [Myxococcales bacterium]|nr:3,4-dehydroadipyl-CoA semialdehyde dehydrogenase [Myxococcales bacterium]
MQQLESYLGGTWQRGEGDGASLYDPTTAQVVARASTRGLDLGAALRHARDVGGPNLRALTFAQRGALLAAMSKAIHAQRESLIEMGRLNGGNTRGDAKFDIDGATGTLMYYAQLGESLGDRTVQHDGDAITIGRSSRLVGQHILTPKPGVAVHINAFNFPAWGLAEKAACALLAGMPVISKPATATAMMTWGLVKAVVDAEVLPEGVLGLLCGGAGDLLDHLEWGDVVAFTGAASTGETIRRHPRVLAAGVAVNVEADSLNATILDADAEDATYDAFIRAVHTEMTQKAGQKCTATRRILVPRDRLDEVIEDLGERLSATVVGDPALDTVRMGPLASEGQLKSAHEGLTALRTQAEVVWGEPERRAFEGVPEGQGFFLSPLLLKATAPTEPGPVHDVEVFGPVSTILPYDGSAAQAAQIVRLGQGSLVASIYGDDKDFLRDTILGLAGWHGRIVVTDAKVADKALAPGMVLPHLLHGGPGRAGGGEELGGTRGMGLYQQRTAVQGNGPLLARLLDA